MWSSWPPKPAPSKGTEASRAKPTSILHPPRQRPKRCPELSVAGRAPVHQFGRGPNPQRHRGHGGLPTVDGRNALRTNLKPWLKPLLVGIYRGMVIPGILRWCIILAIHSMSAWTKPSQRGNQIKRKPKRRPRYVFLKPDEK